MQMDLCSQIWWQIQGEACCQRIYTGPRDILWRNILIGNEIWIHTISTCTCSTPWLGNWGNGCQVGIPSSFYMSMTYYSWEKTFPRLKMLNVNLANCIRWNISDPPHPVGDSNYQRPKHLSYLGQSTGVYWKCTKEVETSRYKQH